MHELHTYEPQGRVLIQGLINFRELAMVVSPFLQQLATNPHLRLMCVTTTNFLFRIRNSKNRPRGVQMFDGSIFCRQLVASRNCHMISLASKKTMRPPLLSQIQYVQIPQSVETVPKAHVNTTCFLTPSFASLQNPHS
jgi:hypothetical protein